MKKIIIAIVLSLITNVSQAATEKVYLKTINDKSDMKKWHKNFNHRSEIHDRDRRAKNKHTTQPVPPELKKFTYNTIKYIEKKLPDVKHNTLLKAQFSINSTKDDKIRELYESNKTPNMTRKQSDKLRKDSLVILVDDDHFYKDYMIEKFLHFYSRSPNNAYSFFVYPIANFPVGQGADGFAINTNYLKGIKSFYRKVVENYKELFLNDDLWISYFLYFFKKNKIYNLQEHIEKSSDGKPPLIYKKHIEASGLIETYGKNLFEAVDKRNQISLESFKYMKEKTKDLIF